MNTTMFVIFLVLAIVVVRHSYQVWFDPNNFLKRMKYIRLQLHRFSFGVFIPKWVVEFFDNNPEFEIGLARLGFPVTYIIILYLLYISLTSK